MSDINYNDILNKLYFNTFLSNNIEKKWSAQLLTNYTNSLEDAQNFQEKLVISLVKDTISKRRETYDKIYQEITDLLQGKVLSNVENADKMFAINAPSNEALTIMNTKAALFDVQNINIELRPYARSYSSEQNNEVDADVERTKTVQAFSKILNENYLSLPEYELAFSEAIKYSRGYPMSVTLIGWDNNAILGASSNQLGNITCENIPITNFWWDLSSNSIDNCEFAFISKNLSYRQIASFIKTLPNNRLDLLNAYVINSSVGKDTTKNTSEIMSNFTLVQNGSIELFSFFHKNIDNKLGKVSIKVYHLVGGALEDTKYIIGVQEFDIPYLPFAILKENSVPDSFTGISSVMLAKTYLQQKALIDNTISSITLLHKDIDMIVNAASGIDSRDVLNDISQEGGRRVFSTNADLGNSIHYLGKPPIDSSLFAWRNSLDNEITKAISSTDAANGLNFGSATNGAAVNAMINQATIKENTSVEELKKYLVRFVRILLSFIRLQAKALSKTKKERLTNKLDQIGFRIKTNSGDTNYDYVLINLLDLEEIDGDIIIDASLLRQSKKQDTLNNLIQLLQFEMQYTKKMSFITLRDIINLLNVPNKESILERIEKEDQANKYQRAVQFAQLVIQGLQQSQETGQDMSLEELVGSILAQMEQGGL